MFSPDLIEIFVGKLNDELSRPCDDQVTVERIRYNVVSAITEIEEFNPVCSEAIYKGIADILDVATATAWSEDSKAVTWGDLFEEMFIQSRFGVRPTTALYYMDLVKRSVINEPEMRNVRDFAVITENLQTIDLLRQWSAGAWLTTIES